MEILLIGGSFMCGLLTYNLLNYFLTKRENKKRVIRNNEAFKEILSVLPVSSSFKSRFLQTAYITAYTDTDGVIDIVYIIDKSDIAIMKNDKILYTSENIDRSLITSIIDMILHLHGKKINDVVNFFGITLSRDDFEKSFKMKFEEFESVMNSIAKYSSEQNEGDVSTILKNNKKQFDIDEILDKISKTGVNSLTIDEKKFLKDYSGNI